MKKFAVLALTLSAMLTFTACGSNEATTNENKTVETAVEETTEVATEEVTVEEVEENVKVAKVTDAEGGVTKATVTYEEGKPVSIAFDYIDADGVSKYEAAASGTYIMTEDGLTWAEQADAMATFLAENNFDVAAITLSDEDGHTDAVAGVSIKVPDMVKAADAVLNN